MSGLLSDFHAKNLTLVVINDVEYMLHNYVLKETIIDNILKDCEADNVIKLTCDVADENIDHAIHCLYETTYGKNNKLSMSACIDIVQFLSYVGISNEKIDTIIYFIIQESVDVDAFGLICECIELTYSEHLDQVINSIFNYCQRNGLDDGTFDKNNLLSITTILREINFPTDKKIYIFGFIVQHTDIYSDTIEEIYQLFGFNNITIETWCHGEIRKIAKWNFKYYNCSDDYIIYNGKRATLEARYYDWLYGIPIRHLGQLLFE